MPQQRWDRLFLGADLATMDADPRSFGVIRDGAVAVRGGRIAWVGRRADLPGRPDELAADVVALDGGWLTPGLIDCHTHLVFAGARAGEWAMRLQGRSYAEIARAGGGILSTVRATRAVDEETLAAAALRRLDGMLADGVTTIEIKSGYGLDPETELKMLRVARALGARRPVRVVTTCLAAHALPPEWRENRAGYIDLVCEEIIPAAARDGLADAVDVFIEDIAFTCAEAARVFAAARRHGLAVKAHAEQLAPTGGAACAARWGALSVDHLEHLDAAGIAAMAEAGTVAVLLPAAFHFLRETKKPPVAGLREAGVPIAVATDCNPGSAPLLAPRLAMHLACTLFGLTPAEALFGMTAAAARALGLEKETGRIAVGLAADLAHWRIDAPEELAYWMGGRLCAMRVFGGEPA
ncbi:MAG: imidazolonepropionase [Rhodothalassiaceae bacterium]|nr:MAG: imidazolonepropionase [Rhodothalassiaceae bacterium]